MCMMIRCGPSSRLNPWPVVSEHFATFRQSSARMKRKDLLEQLTPPLLLGSASVVFSAELSQTAAAGIVAATGVLSAFGFQLAVHLLHRAATWSDSGPAPSPETSQYASLIEELSANTIYASFVSGVSAILALAAGFLGGGWPERLMVGALTILLTHLVVTMTLLMTRVFLLTRAQLNNARSGSSR